MANRIDTIFADLRRSGRRALMPYVTAGDPDLATTAAMLPVMQSAGGAIFEVGFPFSDPIADGPVIQASMTYALSKGVRTGQVLEMIASQRSKLSAGLVAMLSYSIVHRMGGEPFVRECAAAGFDGFIVPDVPVEESGPLLDWTGKHGLVCSFLVSPTTPIERAERIAKVCTGFVYVLSRAGVTGERTELPPDLPERLARFRSVTDLPMAVGFGVSTAQHVRQVVRVADAAIVGSAVMRRIAEHRSAGQTVVVEQVGLLVRELASGLESAGAADRVKSR